MVFNKTHQGTRSELNWLFYMTKITHTKCWKKWWDICYKIKDILEKMLIRSMLYDENNSCKTLKKMGEVISYRIHQLFIQRYY